MLSKQQQVHYFNQHSSGSNFALCKKTIIFSKDFLGAGNLSNNSPTKQFSNTLYHMQKQLICIENRFVVFTFIIHYFYAINYYIIHVIFLKMKFY